MATRSWVAVAAVEGLGLTGIASAARRSGLDRLCRTACALLLVLAAAPTVASAPAGAGAGGEGVLDRELRPTAGRTSADAAQELEETKAEQERLAQQVAQRKRDVAALAAQQADVRAEIDRTASALDAINADLAAVRAQIATTVDRIEQVRARYEQLVAELGWLDAQLADLVAREEAKRVELADRQVQLASRLRQAYEADRTPLLEIFLSAGSFSDVVADVSYHLDVGAQDRAIAARLEVDRATLETLRATIASTRTETNVVRQQTAVRKQELDRELALLEVSKARLAELEAATARELAADRAAFEELTRTRTGVEEQIARGQAAQAELAREIDALAKEQARLAEEERRRAEERRRRAEEARRAREAAARAREEARRAADARRTEQRRSLGGLPSAQGGRLSWPLAGRITGEWGCSEYPGYGPGGPGCEHFHNGIDITGGCGSPVVAAAGGTVAYVGWNWADGPDPAWMVVVAHSSSLRTWYAHLAPSPPNGVWPGARVERGQLIGYEGNTGRSTGCHLHWMVEVNGQFVNGRLFL